MLRGRLWQQCSGAFRVGIWKFPYVPMNQKIPTPMLASWPGSSCATPWRRWFDPMMQRPFCTAARARQRDRDTRSTKQDNNLDKNNRAEKTKRRSITFAKWLRVNKLAAEKRGTSLLSHFAPCVNCRDPQRRKLKKGLSV